jgi:hypothetical protein
MRSDPDPDLESRWRGLANELRGLGLDVVFYLGILTILTTGAISLWNSLPDTVAQARSVAITAGWMTDPPKLRGTL